MLHSSGILRYCTLGVWDLSFSFLIILFILSCSNKSEMFFSNVFFICFKTGKWHLGVNCESRNDFCHHPLNHGFDYFFGTPFTLINDCEASRPSEMLLNYKKKMTFYAQIFIITVLTLLVIKLSHLIIIPWKLFIFAFFGSIFFLYWYVALAFLPHWNCILMRNFDIVEQPMDLELKVSQIVEEAKAFITR